MILKLYRDGTHYYVAYRIEQNTSYFVIDSEDDEKELFEKYIDNGLVNPENVWLMPCCGSRDEHTAKSAMVAELCKKHNFKFSPRLQLVIWNKALRV